MSFGLKNPSVRDSFELNQSFPCRLEKSPTKSTLGALVKSEKSFRYMSSASSSLLWSSLSEQDFSGCTFADGNSLLLASSSLCSYRRGADESVLNNATLTRETLNPNKIVIALDENNRVSKSRVVL